MDAAEAPTALNAPVTLLATDPGPECSGCAVGGNAVGCVVATGAGAGACGAAGGGTARTDAPIVVAAGQPPERAEYSASTCWRSAAICVG